MVYDYPDGQLSIPDNGVNLPYCIFVAAAISQLLTIGQHEAQLVYGGPEDINCRARQVQGLPAFEGQFSEAALVDLVVCDKLHPAINPPLLCVPLNPHRPVNAACIVTRERDREYIRSQLDAARASYDGQCYRLLVKS
jgi:hypothetical protein